MVMEGTQTNTCTLYTTLCPLICEKVHQHLTD